jgi:L-ribulose-5-phosphate 4-epimerase
MSPGSYVPRELKMQVLRTAKELSEFKINPLTQGNISARDPSTGLIVITPHDLPYTTMVEEDLVVIDEHGNRKEGKREVSHESPIHCVVYRERRNVNGIVHSEPVYTNGFGAIHKEIAPIYVNMAIDVGGAVPVMPFADSGNESFAYEMLRVMGNLRAVIWANHGLLTVGDTLDAAFHCTMTVELGAKMYHIALCHGVPIAIPESKIVSLMG